MVSICRYSGSYGREFCRYIYIKEFISPDFEVKHTIVTMKDSREVTNNTREEIVASIKKSKSDNIIITHGTYTMVETAKFIEKRFQEFPTKKIILIGSFWPLKWYSPSDAPFNIGFAMGAISGIQPGIYVAMHSTLFAPHEVEKDVEHAHFWRKKAG